MDFKVRLKRNVYIILAGVLLFAGASQIIQSQFILQFSHNETLKDQIKAWKPQAADEASLKPSGKPYCVSYDSSYPYSAKVKYQIERMLDYMKKPALSIDINKDTVQPESCNMIIAAVSDLETLGDVKVISEYVKGGGYVLLAGQLTLNDAFYQMYRKLGILRTGEHVTTTGIELTSNVLYSESGLRIEDSFITNSSLEVELDEACRILARSANGMPLLWDYRYGQGKFMVFNGSMLEDKMNRGLLTGAISLLEPDFIYPIFNSKLMYIDDFPAPIGMTVDPVIYEQYHRDRPAFFKDIWWPDMLKAAKKYNINYTAVLIQSYNDKVDPPFAAPIDEDSKGLISYGREVIKSGGEIGLHGYNHQSLVLDQSVADEFEYRAWSSVETMAQSISEAVRFMTTAFPKYTMLAYVPPSNVLSPEGREALKQGWPDMAVISSLYTGDSEGIAYTQEYEIAPDGILEMPRVTSGYVDKPSDRWAEANVMTSLGIMSHFIHPDDLLSDERSYGLTWEKLYEHFTHMLSRQESTYPWLRFMTSTQAAIDMEQTLTSRVDWKRDGNRIQGTIPSFRSDIFFVLRSDKNIRSLSHCDARKIDSGTYLIAAHQANFEIELGD